MVVNELSVLIADEAGAGIMRSCSLLAKACLREGLHVFAASDYPSLIRGGHKSRAGNSRVKRGTRRDWPVSDALKPSWAMGT